MFLISLSNFFFNSKMPFYSTAQMQWISKHLIKKMCVSFMSHQMSLSLNFSPVFSTLLFMCPLFFVHISLCLLHLVSKHLKCSKTFMSETIQSNVFNM